MQVEPILVNIDARLDKKEDGQRAQVLELGLVELKVRHSAVKT